VVPWCYTGNNTIIINYGINYYEYGIIGYHINYGINYYEYGIIRVDHCSAFTCYCVYKYV